jgi:hypothetical protein
VRGGVKEFFTTMTSRSFPFLKAATSALCRPPNKQLQRTVIDRVQGHMRRRAAAELRR